MAVILQPDSAGINQAAAALRDGGVVVFPTETVYGIGADLFNVAAVRRLFEIKGRPLGMPLLAHCANEAQMRQLVASVGVAAKRLMARYWPGPLALVFLADAAVPSVVTAGTRTIGIRMVAHPAAKAMISSLGRAVAGTSANLHGRPATSQFVALDRQLLDSVDAVIDAGVCGDDVPSTVVDVTTETPRVIRPGAVSRDELAAIVKLRPS